MDVQLCSASSAQWSMPMSSERIPSLIPRNNQDSLFLSPWGSHVPVSQKQQQKEEIYQDF